MWALDTVRSLQAFPGRRARSAVQGVGPVVSTVLPSPFLSMIQDLKFLRPTVVSRRGRPTCVTLRCPLRYGGTRLHCHNAVQVSLTCPGGAREDPRRAEIGVSTFWHCLERINRGDQELVDRFRHALERGLSMSYTYRTDARNKIA